MAAIALFVETGFLRRKNANSAFRFEDSVHVQMLFSDLLTSPRGSTKRGHGDADMALQPIGHIVIN
jgi:hypothetical protein